MEKETTPVDVAAVPAAASPEVAPLASTFDDQINGLPALWHRDDQEDLWIKHLFHCAFTSDEGERCSFKAAPTQQVNAFVNGKKQQMAALQIVEVWEVTPKLDERGRVQRDSQGRELEPIKTLVFKDVYHTAHAKDTMAGAREAGLHPEMKPLYGYLQNMAEKRRGHEKYKLAAEAVTKYFIALLSGEASIEDGMPLGAVQPTDTRGAENFLINTETYEVVGAVPTKFGWCFTEARKSQGASKRYYLFRGTEADAERQAKSWSARESNTPSTSQRPVPRNDAARREENRALAASRFAALRRSSPASVPAPLPSAPSKGRGKKGKGRDASKDRDEATLLTQPVLSADKAKAIRDGLSETESAVASETTEAVVPTAEAVVAAVAAAFGGDDSSSE